MILLAKQACQSSNSISRLGNPETRANFDSLHRFTIMFEQRKKSYLAPATEEQFAKCSKGNKISTGSKKQKQGFNSENQIEIEPDSETYQSDQLD
ncbi:MAG: hypothetical protein EZS28_023397 [Streblomastix strix]|uniref:Uncharacterized protein n=1 Tax=Streblomastix strix TaxID=222440 RepID=A0A5J4VEV1_9EUKA|nr:MAG: hypothetical protein EZS28_023397 [Streblomastix strix]